MAGSHFTRNRPTGPHPIAIAFSVFLTAVAGVVVFFVGVGIANDSYRAAHQLPPIEAGFWIFRHYEDAPVSLAQLGVGTVLMLAALAVMYAVFLHPLLGRLVQAVSEFLTRHIVSVYRVDEEWAPE
jgi:hypothetical protein